MKTKGSASRGGNRKRGSDVAENYTPQPVGRPRKSSSNPHRGHQNQGDRETLQDLLLDSLSEPATQEEALRVDNSGDKSCSSLQPQPLQPERIRRQRRRSKIAGCFPVQKCPTSNVDAGQAMVPLNGLSVELWCDPSSQAAQFGMPLEEDASNRASCKSDLRSLFRWIDVIKSDRGTGFPDKFSLLTEKVGEFVLLQEKKTGIEIANVKQESQFSMAKLKGAIADLEDQCRLHSQARSVLQKDNEVLQKKIETLPELEVLYWGHLNANLEAAENFGHEIKCGFLDCLKQMTQGEILSKILSLSEIIRGLNLELQRRSREQESCVNLIQLKPGEANGRHEQKSHHEQEPYVKSKPGEANGHEQLDFAKSGSYSDEGATPNLLDKAVFDTKADVTSFQKVFLEVFKLRQKNLWDLSDVFFARKQHIGFYVRSAVNEFFFEGFENESFNTFSGVSRFLDPDKRQTKFYQYYKDSGDIIHDPQFRDFCRAKASSFWKMFPEYNGKSPKVCCCFEDLAWDLGGPELGNQLALSFKAAARSVWLLHKLAFSFEPPASIFRVERGADVDPHYMETVVKLEDNERFVPKVGFMITPGLRLGKNVIRSDVYLARREVPIES